MKTNKKEKDLDAVKMMREIRDKISAETQNMTLEQSKSISKINLTKTKPS